MREGVDGEWVWFQQVLIDCDIMLQKQKEKFRNTMIPEFTKKLKAVLDEFNNAGQTHSIFHTLIYIIHLIWARWCSSLRFVLFFSHYSSVEGLFKTDNQVSVNNPGSMIRSK